MNLLSRVIHRMGFFITRPKVLINSLLLASMLVVYAAVAHAAFPGARIAYKNLEGKAVGICDPQANVLLDSRIPATSQKSKGNYIVARSCSGQGVALQSPCNSQIPAAQDDPYVRHLQDERGYDNEANLTYRRGPDHTLNILAPVAGKPLTLSDLPTSGNRTITLAKIGTEYRVRIFNVESKKVVDQKLDDYVDATASSDSKASVLAALKKSIDSWQTNPHNTTTLSADIQERSSSLNNVLTLTGYVPKGDILYLPDGKPQKKPTSQRSCAAMGMTPMAPFAVAIEFDPKQPLLQADGTSWGTTTRTTTGGPTMPEQYYPVNPAKPERKGAPVYTSVTSPSGEAGTLVDPKEFSSLDYSGGTGSKIKTSAGEVIYTSVEWLIFTGLRPKTHTSTVMGLDEECKTVERQQGSYVYIRNASNKCVVSEEPYILTDPCTNLPYKVGDRIRQIDSAISTATPTCIDQKTLGAAILSVPSERTLTSSGTLYSRIFPDQPVALQQQIQNMSTSIVEIEVGKSAIIQPPLGVTFEVRLENSKACVYAHGADPNKVWRVLDRFPASEAEVRDQLEVKGFPCAGNNRCVNHTCVAPLTGNASEGVGRYCLDSKTSSIDNSNETDHCVDVPAPVIERRTLVWSSLISEICTNYDTSHSHARVPFSSVVVQCIEESVKRIFYPPEDAPVSFFDTTRDLMKGIVRGALTIFVIIFAYKLMIGKQNIPSKAEATWFVLKFAMVVYFAMGTGMTYLFPKFVNISKALSIMVMEAGLGLIADNDLYAIQSAASYAQDNAAKAKKAYEDALANIGKSDVGIGNLKEEVAAADAKLAELNKELGDLQNNYNQTLGNLENPVLTKPQSDFLDAVYGALMCNSTSPSCYTNLGCSAPTTMTPSYSDMLELCKGKLGANKMPTTRQQLQRATDNYNSKKNDYNAKLAAYNALFVPLNSTQVISVPATGSTNLSQIPMSYTVPSLCSKVKVELWGGGASGQWCYQCSATDYSGGAGGYASIMMDVKPNTVLTGSVGRGGGGYASATDYTAATVGVTKADHNKAIPAGLAGDGFNTSFTGVDSNGTKITLQANGAKGRTGGTSSGSPASYASLVTKLGNSGVATNIGSAAGATSQSSTVKVASVSSNGSLVVASTDLIGTGQPMEACNKSSASRPSGTYVGRAVPGAGGCATDDYQSVEGWGAGGDGRIQITCLNPNNSPTFNDLKPLANNNDPLALSLMKARDELRRSQELLWLAGDTNEIPPFHYYYNDLEVAGHPAGGSAVSPLAILNKEMQDAEALFSNAKAALQQKKDQIAALLLTKATQEEAASDAALVKTKLTTDIAALEAAYNSALARADAASTALSNYLLNQSTSPKLQDSSSIPNTGYTYCDFRTHVYTPGFEAVKLWDMVDCKIAKYLGIGDNAGNKSAPQLIWVSLLSIISSSYGLLIFILGLILLSFMIMVSYRIVHIYIMAYISLALLVFMSPLLIPAVLFEQTKRYFNGWLKLIISFILQPVILFAFLSFLFAITDQAFFGGNHHFNAENQIVGTTGTVAKDASECEDKRALACIFQVVDIYTEKVEFLNMRIYKVDFNGDQDKDLFVGILKLILVIFVGYYVLLMVEDMSLRLTGSSFSGSAASMSAVPVPSIAQSVKIIGGTIKNAQEVAIFLPETTIKYGIKAPGVVKRQAVALMKAPGAIKRKALALKNLLKYGSTKGNQANTPGVNKAGVNKSTAVTGGSSVLAKAQSVGTVGTGRTPPPVPVRGPAHQRYNDERRARENASASSSAAGDMAGVQSSSVSNTGNGSSTEAAPRKPRMVGPAPPPPPRSVDNILGQGQAAQPPQEGVRRRIIGPPPPPPPRSNPPGESDA